MWHLPSGTLLGPWTCRAGANRALMMPMPTVSITHHYSLLAAPRASHVITI